jgi:signal recognition particle subunit SEC65
MIVRRPRQENSRSVPSGLRAKRARKPAVIEFARKLKMHAKTEEDLSYPAVLMVGKLLKQGT